MKILIKMSICILAHFYEGNKESNIKIVRSFNTDVSDDGLCPKK